MSELDQAENGYSHTQSYKVKEVSTGNGGNIDSSPLKSYKKGIINTTAHNDVYNYHKDA